MTSRRSSGDEVVFKIGSQEAVNISNVAGNQYVQGPQQGNITTADVSAQLDVIDRILDELGLSAGVLAEARKDLRDAQSAVEEAEPDKERVGSKLESMTYVLKSVGGLVGAGAALLAPLGSIIGWLGAAGQGLATLLKD